MSLYQAIDVWKRVSGKELLRYRCFKNLETNRYSVQSADFYSLPLDTAQATNLEKQSCELFAERLPDERAAGFASIDEAIAAHTAILVSK
ncbi:MAG TPA: hypothetical protein VKV30_13220 [Candidatus Angelobacter sp.]|nr:hypothetical protein [Candidatus Angelobacter sp.]